MDNEDILQTFLRAADKWVCDRYTIDIRYLSNIEGREFAIWDALVYLNPLPPSRDFSFHINTGQFAVGQIQRPGLKKSELTRLLHQATVGELATEDGIARVKVDKKVGYWSEMLYPGRWLADLHLQVSGEMRPFPSGIEYAAIENSLRKAKPPFDGLADAAAWLGLGNPGAKSHPPSINIRVMPPVGLIFEECRLDADSLTLTLHAHPKFDVRRVGLAVRAAPGNGLDGRRQIGEMIKWGRVKDGLRVGIAQVMLAQADSILAMLMIEDMTVQRQWIIDTAKARNNRWVAVQHFDKELRKIRDSVFDSQDSTRFEHGVAALLFLLGFTPSVQLESDAPDLIVTTPGGRLIVVECTTRIADFSAKIGKLVDRRGALTKQLTAAGHSAQVISVLICRLPRDQIAAQADELRALSTILVAGEDLATAFDRVRFPQDPDTLVQSAMEWLARGFPANIEMPQHPTQHLTL